MRNLLATALGRALYLADGISGPGLTTGAPHKPPPSGAPRSTGQGAAASAAGQSGGPGSDGAQLHRLPEGKTDPTHVSFPDKPGATPQGPSPADSQRYFQDQDAVQAAQALIRSGARAELAGLARSTASPGVQALISQLDPAEYRDALLALAANRNNTPEVFRTLAASQDQWVVLAVAANRAAPPELLDELARNPDPQRRLPNDSARELLGQGIRQAIAGDPRLSPHTLRFLATQSDALTRERVAGNPAAELDVIERLSRDNDEVVRQTAVTELARRAGSPAVETRRPGKKR